MSDVKGGLRLSVLDQSPVLTGSTPAESLERSIELARRVDELGYQRFWMSEHHAMDTLACTAPEIMLARIGAETKRIRIGSGGIMLPHYTPLKIAEVFRTLYALYPERVDLGVGRAPGGGPMESLALRRSRKTPMEDDFPDQVAELLAFLEDGFPQGHPFSRVRAMPAAALNGRYAGPDVWMLGSSMWSSAAAVEFGLPYSFAHFFSPVKTREAITAYKRSFTAGVRRSQPEATVAVGVVCAETQEEAEYLATSVKLLQRRIRLGDRRPVASPEEALRELRLLGDVPMEEGEWPRYFGGTPAFVREHLEQMAGELGISEIIVNTIVWDHAKRARSYELLAREFGLAG
ncbi:LLM class flavin-dependent oxidoreductase [Edaphobacter bradus]|uniref:LLM class flavin-dependent oxidoreductase n=1 Tax=Edaphobacter bradus TaxID=2259016 RepID=UPI0021DFDB8C|nr:LLM class flavin-dependent oxidoreductase [Edaphobacter bradus]